MNHSTALGEFWFLGGSGFLQCAAACPSSCCNVRTSAISHLLAQAFRSESVVAANTSVAEQVSPYR